MPDEQKIKAEELSDEQMNEASGGGSTAGDPTKKPKKCANPNCQTMLPYNYPSDLCQKCREAATGGGNAPAGFQIPKANFPGYR